MRDSSCRSSLVRALAVLQFFALSACSSESRLVRISPFSSDTPDSDRVNLFPLAYSDRGATAVLWPLMDFDRRGFAVRPLVSKDDSEWDVLFPLSHVDGKSGEGWILNAYSLEHDRGLFPLANLGEWSWATLGWWHRDPQTEQVDRWGIFPIACHSDDVSYYGPLWTKSATEHSKAGFGLIPLFSELEDFQQYGPLWFAGERARGDSSFGLFPLYWSFDDESLVAVAPLWLHDRKPERSLDAFLIPPTWWETTPDSRTHVVLPFYAHLQRADGRESLFTPLSAYSSDATGNSSFLGLLVPPTWWDTKPQSEHHYVLPFYAHVQSEDRDFTAYPPLWWSWRSQEGSGHSLAPFYLYREKESARTLLTPLGGYGWNADGSSRFVNVLGPFFHHSSDGDAATTAVLWPLFERDRNRDSDSWRLWPLYAQSDAATPPDVLYDFTLVGRETHADSWSAHVFPLYWGSARGEGSSHTALLGLARVAMTRNGSAWRFVPLASGSSDPAADGLVDELTLFRRERRDDGVSTRLFPLYWGAERGEESSHTALLGLARVATTPKGSSWRLVPLASASSDPAADQLADECTLFRRERRDDVVTTRLFPLYSGEHGGDVAREELLLSLFRHDRRGADEAWRAWPLCSSTTGAGSSDVIDSLTLVGWHPHPEKTHLHVGTSAVFGLDRYGEEKRSWKARALTLITCEHEEAPPREPTMLVRNRAGFLFDWFLVENDAMQAQDGTRFEKRHWRLPLLHEYESDRDATEWDALLWAVHSKEQPGESSFSVLYYGYRQVTKGDETKRDIFPFITYDTAPQKSRFSFLWRLWHYERDGERRGGHILFIPWGDA